MPIIKTFVLMASLPCPNDRTKIEAQLDDLSEEVTDARGEACSDA